MEFSCIGDAVNLSSRIEGLTKYYNLTILITEHTLKETEPTQFYTREIDRVIVTGKSSQVSIYEVLGRKGEDGISTTDLSESMRQTVNLYDDGLRLYRQRMFEEAEMMFKEAILLSDDGPSKTMETRCRLYKENPPPPEWDGVYRFDSK